MKEPFHMLLFTNVMKSSSLVRPSGPSQLKELILQVPYARRTFVSLVALYHAMRLRFGYGFESCDANGPRNVKNTNPAKHRPVLLPTLLLVGSKELVLKVPKRGQFHAAICVTLDAAIRVPKEH